MAPRPTHDNINAWEESVVNILSTIPSQQSADHGYQGMVQHPIIYALVCSEPWEEWADPGPTRRGTEYNPHPEFGTNLTPEQIKAEEAVYDARLRVHKNERVVKQAVIDCLNRSVPESYRRNQGIGTRMYKISDDPRTIIAGLRERYGQATPEEKEQNERRFGQGWLTASQSFEDFTAILERCYVAAVHARPPFTVEQMLDKGVTGVMKTGLYQTALLEWNGFDAANKTWDEFKAHFAEAYDIHLQTTQTSGQLGYHGANAAMDDDDSSIATINESLANLQTVSIENTRTMNDNISQLTATTNDLRQGLVQAQMALAAMARGNNSPWAQVHSRSDGRHCKRMYLPSSTSPHPPNTVLQPPNIKDTVVDADREGTGREQRSWPRTRQLSWWQGRKQRWRQGSGTWPSPSWRRYPSTTYDGDTNAAAPAEELHQVLQ